MVSESAGGALGVAQPLRDPHERQQIFSRRVGQLAWRGREHGNDWHYSEASILGFGGGPHRLSLRVFERLGHVAARLLMHHDAYDQLKSPGEIR